MRIGFVTTMFDTPWGGSEELWAEAAHAALDRGDEVHLYLFRFPELAPKVRALADRGAVLHLRPRASDNMVRKALYFANMERPDAPVPTRLTTHRALASAELDVLCVNQGDPYGTVRENPALVRWLRATGTPYLVLVHYAADHQVLRPHDSAMARRFFEGARRVAFVSEGNRRTVERQFATSLADAAIVRNPVNLRDRSPVPWPDGETAQLATVAKLGVNHKGQDVLFEALSDPSWAERDWRLNLFGSGPDEEYLRELARHFGIAGRVAFRGFTDAIRDLWATQHVHVLASRAEGIPISLVESLLCARPAVVTDVAGHREWVTEGETGWIAGAPTAAELDGALRRAFDARDRWEEMGLRAHEVALAQSGERHGEALLALLDEAAGASQAPRANG